MEIHLIVWLISVVYVGAWQKSGKLSVFIHLSSISKVFKFLARHLCGPMAKK